MGFIMQIWFQTPSELLMNLVLFPFVILQVSPLGYVLAYLRFLLLIRVRIKLLFLPQRLLLLSYNLLVFEICLMINMLLFSNVALIVIVVKFFHLSNRLITHIRLFWRHWFYLLDILHVVVSISEAIWEVNFCVQYAGLLIKEVIIKSDLPLKLLCIGVSISETFHIYVLRIWPMVIWVSCRPGSDWGKFHPRSIIHRWLS